jgi:DMSO reductase anchor subunit
MGIGASIFLIAVGGILGFAVEDNVRGVDLNMVGWILMVAGVVGLFMTTLIFGRSDRTVVGDEHVTHHDHTVH